MTHRIYTFNETVTHNIDVDYVEERIYLIFNLIEELHSSCICTFGVILCVKDFAHLQRGDVPCLLSCQYFLFFAFVSSPQMIPFFSKCLCSNTFKPTLLFLFLWRLGHPRLPHSFVVAFFTPPLCSTNSNVPLISFLSLALFSCCQNDFTGIYFHIFFITFDGGII